MQAIPYEVSAMSAVKQRAHQLIDTLPETAGWDELAREADRGEFVLRSEAVRVVRLD